MKNDSKTVRDYLAVCLVGAGSSFARGPDKQETIDRCVKITASDWSSIFDLDGKEATINVWDVTGRSEVWWDHQGLHTTEDEKLGELPAADLVKVTLKVPRRRR